MRAANASDDEIEQYLQGVEGLKPVSSAPAGRSFPAVPAAASDMTASGAPRGGQPSPAFQAAAFKGTDPDVIGPELTNVSQGIPGMRAVEAGIASKVYGVPYATALKASDAVVGSLPPSHQVIGKMAGAALLAPVLPSNVIGAGAVLGGADQALSADPDKTLGQRITSTALGAGGGAAMGGVLKGAGNVAQKIGLTDAVAGGLRRLGGPAADVGQSIGTTGAANRLLAQRQSLLDQLSTADQTSGEVMNAQVDARKAEANALYNAARNDKSLIADPRVGTAMQDPRMQTLFQVVRQRLGLPSNPVTVTQGSPLMSSVVAGHVGPGAPTVTAPTPAAAVTPPGPPGRMGVALVPATPGSVSVDLPSPEDLAMAKRLLGQIVTQKFAAGGIEPGEAAQLAPQIDALRSALHDASPAWAKADQFYTNAMGFERGYQKAYGMQSTPSADALTPNKLKNPESITSWMQGGPALARTSGVQAGAAQRIASAIKKAPLQSDIDQTLAGANGVLAPTAPAAAARSLAFGTPPDAAQFENTLTTLRQGARQDAASRAPWTLIPARPFNRFRATNPLDTPQGRTLLDQMGVQPNVRAPTAAMARGDAMADYLRNLGLVSANSPFANP